MEVNKLDEYVIKYSTRIIWQLKNAKSLKWKNFFQYKFNLIINYYSMLSLSQSTFLLNLSQNFIQKNFEKNNQLISDENGFDKRLKVLGTNYVFSVHAFLEKPLSLNFQIYDPVCDLEVKFPCSFWLVDPKSFSKQTRKIFISLPLYA